MYEFMPDVNGLVAEMIDNYNFKPKSQEFYKARINKFFIDYMGIEVNKSKPIKAITYYDIDTYIGNLKYSDADKANNYNALKCFFSFTYSKGITSDIMSQVLKPTYERKPKVVLEEERYKRLTEFITDRKNDVVERLALGLFTYTGLSRQYIASLRNNQFFFERGLYFLEIWKDENEIKLPLKSELQLLINEYCMILPDDKKLNKVLDMDENSISTYISNLTEKATGKKYTPTILSNTFISKALSNGNYIWEVSKLTLESVSTIEQHVKDIENLVYRQTSILNSF